MHVLSTKISWILFLLSISILLNKNRTRDFAHPVTHAVNIHTTQRFVFSFFYQLVPLWLTFLGRGWGGVLFFSSPCSTVCEITWCFWGCCFNTTQKFYTVCAVVQCTGVNSECKACWGRTGGREKAKSVQPCLCCLLEHFLESVIHRLMHGTGSKSASWCGPKPCYGVLYQQSTVPSALSHCHILFIGKM